MTNSQNRTIWILILSSSLILAITMGVRQSLGLFIAPINSSTSLDIVSISLALAIGQFIWGLTQPIFGAIADKKGSFGVLVFGALLMFFGLILTPFLTSEFSIILTLGLLVAAGAGAGSFSILIGATAKNLPNEKRSFAGGFINAGGSFGQFIFAPLAQAMGETAPLIIIGMIAFIPDAPSMVTQAATVMPAQLFTWAGMPEGMYIEKTAAGILVLLTILISLNAIAIYLRKKLEVKW